MSFKIKVPDTKKLQEALRKIFPEITSPQNMTRYGNMAVDMIKTRTRLGSGVSSDGQNKQKLKPLADSTKRSRESKKRAGKLSELTTPGRSNLTDSGQMLDSMTVTKVAQGTVTVAPRGARREGGTNEKVAAHVSEKGRAFNALSRVEFKRINDQVKKDIRAFIKRLLT